jgi:hypothetical protein
MINLKPELRVDGAVVATGGAITMGSAENVKMAFHDPTRGDDVVANVIEAGEYWGIAVDVASISKTQVEGIRARLENTKTQLEARNFAGITKDDILGDLLYTTAMIYHAEMDMFDRIQAQSGGLRTVRLPSQAIFKTSLAVEESFGVPTSVGVSSLTMDVDRLLSLDKAFDGDRDVKLNFMISSGLDSSALEHRVIEQMFSTPESPVTAVSAVKALHLAFVQGIPTYTVTRENVNAIVPMLSFDEAVIGEIRNAVHAGNVVTVPQTSVDFHGVAVAGYIALNPDTGEGAYMISGGDNGGKTLPGVLSFELYLLISFTILTYTAAIIESLAVNTAMGAANAVLLMLSLASYVSTLMDAIDMVYDEEITSDRGREMIVTASFAAVSMNFIAITTAGTNIGGMNNEIGLWSMSVWSEFSFMGLFAMFAR